jgi:chromate reductase, NAD(P)H dehydrogenase (quinone)
MPDLDVAVITGSLRKESFSRKMGRAAIKLAPPGMKPSIVEIGDMQHYNEDLESNPPAAFTRFRERITAADAVLFVTPEFNRGMPGVLKNCIDVGSRPWGKSIWNGKIAAVMSMSPGNVGGFGAQHALRQSLMSVNVATMPHPETYLNGADKFFDDAGELVDASIRELVTDFMRAFLVWIQRLSPGRK